jgi:hypothetical protein
MKNHLSISIATILALSVPSMVKAQLYVNAVIGGIPSVGGATLENFDEPNPPILTLSGAAYLLTGSDGVASPPIFSGATAAYFGESPATGSDASQYVGVEPGGSATLSFSTPQNYFGLYWGTIDPYSGMNVLTFYDNANNVIGTVDGGNVLSANSSLSPGDAAYVNITSTSAFSKVVATATPIYPESFEFDDVAYAMVVPEPASCVLMGAGLCVLAFVLRPKLSSCVGSKRV